MLHLSVLLFTSPKLH